MNSLKDKLLEAGLITEEAARKAEDERQAARKRERAGARRGSKREDPKRVARPARPKEERLTPEEVAAAEAKRAERERQRALAAEREANRKRAAEDRAKAEDVRRVAEHLGVEAPGEQVFFFQTRRRKLQRMLLSQEAVDKLASGELAVIENPLPHALEFKLVPREAAEAVLKIEPRSVRFYNRSETESYGGQ